MDTKEIGDNITGESMKSDIELEDILSITKEISQEELAPRAQEVDKTGKWPE